MDGLAKNTGTKTTENNLRLTFERILCFLLEFGVGFGVGFPSMCQNTSATVVWHENVDRAEKVAYLLHITHSIDFVLHL